MAWSVPQVLAWLDRVEPRAEHLTHFEWLEMVPSASSLAIQNAYHAVARTRHPDLLRTTLGPRDHDRLVRMYARVANAYAALRSPDAAARYLRELRDGRDSARMLAVTPPGGTPAIRHTPTSVPAQTPPTGIAALVPTPPRGTPPAPEAPPAIETDPSRAMNARALAHYRRAEGAMRTGDRVTALLQIRMAIAADPRSLLLRAALAELQGKG